jgi:hypothetical protein
MHVVEKAGQSRGTSTLVHQSGPALCSFVCAVNAPGPCTRGSNTVPASFAKNYRDKTNDFLWFEINLPC